jgi:hypothetical protein
VGKLLAVPLLLVRLALLPGVLLYLLVGFWQPPGEALSWLASNLDILWRVVHVYGAASLWLVGVSVLASCTASRGGGALVVAIVVFIGGGFASNIGRRMDEPVRSGLLSLNVTANAIGPLRIAGHEQDRLGQSKVSPALRRRAEADSTVFWTACGALNLVALLLVWRRARTTEVSG